MCIHQLQRVNNVIFTVDYTIFFYIFILYCRTVSPPAGSRLKSVFKLTRVPRVFPAQSHQVSTVMEGKLFSVSTQTFEDPHS